MKKKFSLLLILCMLVSSYAPGFIMADDTETHANPIVAYEYTATDNTVIEETAIETEEEAVPFADNAAAVPNGDSEEIIHLFTEDDPEIAPEEEIELQATIAEAESNTTVETTDDTNDNAAQPIVVASGECGDNLTWTLDENGLLTISGTGAMTNGSSFRSGYTDSIKSVVIENGVTSIGSQNFYRCKNLASVTIADTVTSIGAWAFGYCESLASIEVPSRVYSIGSAAFVVCTSLEEIIVDPDNTSYVSIDGVLFSKDTKTLICYPAGKTETSYTIFNDVTKIYTYAFCGSKTLSNITIPKSVTSIGGSAFAACSALTDVYYSGSKIDWNAISGSSTSLTNATIHYGKLPSGIQITALPYKTEYFTGDTIDLTGLKVAVVYPDGTSTQITDYDVSECNMSAAGIHTIAVTYAGYTAEFTITVEELIIASGECGDGVTWAFDKRDNLIIGGSGAMDRYLFEEAPWNEYKDDVIHLIIEDGVTFISSSAFYDCDSIRDITIPQSVTEIYSGAFPDCDSLADINVAADNACYKSQDGILFTKDGTTIVCYPKGKSDYSYIVPDTVTTIGAGAFWGSKLTEITLSKNVTAIGNGAFANCTSLTELMLPDTVEQISGNAFLGCAELESFVIPQGVESIGESAFQGCTALREITIPVSVTYIASCVFDGCTALEEVHYAGTPEQWNTVEIMENNDVLSSVTVRCPVVWSLSEDGVLTISGNSAIADYTYTENAPWYEHRDTITAVIIEEGVTAIGNLAFYNLPNLTEIIIPESLTKIGDNAFECCALLAEVSIPASVNHIGKNVFWGCYALTGISVDENNTDYSSVDGVLFDKDVSKLIVYPLGKADDTYEIPSGVQAIEEFAFMSNDKLTQIVICDGVASLGVNSFAFCVRLKSITLPYGVASIPDNVFAHCYSLESITIPESAKQIGKNAFANCMVLNNVYFCGTDYEWEAVSVGSGNDSLTNATVHIGRELVGVEIATLPQKTVYYMGDALNLTGLVAKAVYSDGASAEITDYTISGCDMNTAGTQTIMLSYRGFSAEFNINVKLLVSGTCGTNLTWTLNDEGLLTISGRGDMNDRYTANATWYEYKDKIISVVIEEGVTSVGSQAFYNCASLTDVVIPEGVLSIGNFAFQSCTSLTNVELPDTLTSIGTRAFAFCQLDSLIIPRNVTEIGVGAFISCDFKEVVIPDGITTIAEDTFNSCIDIKRIVIGSGVHTIVPSAFRSCTPEEIIVNPANTHFVVDGEALFTIDMTSLVKYCHTNSAKVYTIPDTVTSICDFAFQSSRLEQLIIPESVSEIGYGFIGYANYLKSIIVAENNQKYTSLDNILFTKDMCTLVCYPPKKAGSFYVIPDTVAVIDDFAFSVCKNLKNVIFSDSVTEIGDFAFASCSSLERVTIPDSVTTIGQQAFSHCRSMERAVIGNGLTEISSGMFSNCEKLRGVIIGNGVTLIDSVAFANCLSLTTLAIPDTVETIRSQAFQNCTSITSLKIPNGTTVISGTIFDSCTSLKSIIVPSSVTSILGTEDTFKNITDIYFCGTETEWERASRNIKNYISNATVHCNAVIDRFAEDITITNLPVKNTYYVGEELDLSGMSVVASLFDGSETEVFGYTIDGFDSTVAGDKTVTISYGDCIEQFAVIVKDRLHTDAPTITISSIKTLSDEEISLDIALVGNPGIASMALDVSYDNRYLTLTDVKDGSILGDKLHSDNLTLNPYVLTWANDTATENFTADGIIATLTFKVSEDAPADTYPICVSYDNREHDIFDVDLNAVDFNVIDGAIEVLDYLTGDVNGDRGVNTLDRAILSRYLSKWAGYATINEAASDVNVDGSVNALDRAILARHLSGWTGYETLPYINN